MRRRAFTLMEVLVTVVILGTAIVMLAQGLTGAIRANARVQRVSLAAVAADEVFQRMELGEIDFLSQSTGSFADFGPVEILTEEEAAWRSAYSWHAEVTDGDAENLYRVTLVIAWDDQGPESQRAWTFERLFYKADEAEEEETQAGPQGP